MDQTECYTAAGYGGDRKKASRLATNGDIKARILHLKKMAETSLVLSLQEKREFLREVVKEAPCEIRDKLNAIKIDNDMSGDNAPVKQSHEVVVESREDWLRRIRGRQDDAPDA